MKRPKAHAEVGKFLKDARLARKLTQDDLAMSFGYTCKQYISNIERGLVLPPKKRLTHLCHLLGIDKDHIVALMAKSYFGEKK